MALLKGTRGYEVCISQIRRQKTNLNCSQHILRLIKQYSSWNTGTQVEKLKLKKLKTQKLCTHNNNLVLNDLQWSKI
jgi:hypothetical protein